MIGEILKSLYKDDIYRHRFGLGGLFFTGALFAATSDIIADEKPPVPDQESALVAMQDSSQDYIPDGDDHEVDMHDPRFSSPEATLRTLIEAYRSRDMLAYIGCLDSMQSGPILGDIREHFKKNGTPPADAVIDIFDREDAGYTFMETCLDAGDFELEEYFGGKYAILRFGNRFTVERGANGGTVVVNDDGRSGTADQMSMLFVLDEGLESGFKILYKKHRDPEEMMTAKIKNELLGTQADSLQGLAEVNEDGRVIPNGIDMSYDRTNVHQTVLGVVESVVNGDDGLYTSFWRPSGVQGNTVKAPDLEFSGYVIEDVCLLTEQGVLSEDEKTKRALENHLISVNNSLPGSSGERREGLEKSRDILLRRLSRHEETVEHHRSFEFPGYRINLGITDGKNNNDRVPKRVTIELAEKDGEFLLVRFGFGN